MLTFNARTPVRCVIPGLLLLCWMMPANTPAAGQGLSPLTPPGQSIPQPVPADGETSSGCLNLLESEGTIQDGTYEEYVGEEPVYEDCEGTVFCNESYCGPACQTWMRFDYLLWWTNGSRLPPLVTTSPADQPPGVLGDPDTRVLFGDSRVNEEGRSNFRATLGHWFDCTHQFGVVGDYFDLGTQDTRYSNRSVGDPVLTRPFFDVQQSYDAAAQQIAYPVGIVSGLGGIGCVDVSVHDYFTASGVALRFNLWSDSTCFEADSCEIGGTGCGGGQCYDADRVRVFRLDLITGYRHYRLGDSLRISEMIVSTAPDALVTPGTVFELTDGFRADNEFNGGELGLIAQIQRGRWSFEFLAKLAIGENRQTVAINGQTAVTVPGFATVTHDGGLLALPSNSGTFTGGDLALIPQFGAEVGFQVTERMRAYVGYNLLLWAHIGRAGDQIDLNVNLSQANSGNLVGSAEPEFTFQDSNFWAQGLNVGCEFCF